MKLLAVLMVLLVIGCVPQGVEDNSDYRSGSDGVQITFGDSNRKVYEGSKMNLVLEIRNRRATDLRNGRVYITGHDPVSISFQDTELDLPEVMGKNA